MDKRPPLNRKVLVFEVTTKQNKIAEYPSINSASKAHSITRQGIYHSASSNYVLIDLKKGTKLVFRFKDN